MEPQGPRRRACRGGRVRHPGGDGMERHASRIHRMALREQLTRFLALAPPAAPA
jgi:hypothetical protein